MLFKPPYFQKKNIHSIWRTLNYRKNIHLIIGGVITLLTLISSSCRQLIISCFCSIISVFKETSSREVGLELRSSKFLILKLDYERGRPRILLSKQFLSQSTKIIFITFPLFKFLNYSGAYCFVAGCHQ